MKTYNQKKGGVVRIVKNLCITLISTVVAVTAWSNGHEPIVVGFMVAMISLWKLEYNEHNNK
jgi:hypothetical protein